MIRPRLLHRLGLGALDEAGLSRRRGEGVAFLLGGLGGLGEAGLLGIDVDHAFEREDEGRLIDDDLRRAAAGDGACRIASMRASRVEAPASLSISRAVARALASDDAGVSFAPGGTFSSARAARMPPISADQPVDLRPRLAVERPASGIGHLARIRGYGRSPIACHSSSVTNGMNGWSMTRIWSSTQPATARVSVVASLVDLALDQLEYQSQKVAQMKW